MTLYTSDLQCNRNNNYERMHPVTILNELYPPGRTRYQLISTTGPGHARVYTIRASVNGMSFEGWGRSKKDAKFNAAEALLQGLGSYFENVT